MRKHKHVDWLDELIYNEDLSDEAIYAIYLFLEQALVNFEMKAFHKLRKYRHSQENTQKKPPFNEAL
jgi:hypothetical protein